MQNILIVIVLYNQNIKESITIQQIKKYFFKNKKILPQIFLYDNSKISQQTEAQSFFNLPIHYVHDKNNSGTRGAYQAAYHYAHNNHLPWLLLLDQDTHITTEYLIELDTIINNSKNLNDLIVAVIPKIFHKQIQISPTKANVLQNIKHPVTEVGIHKNITAISSCTLLSINFLNSIGGFSSDFSLDYLDYWIFFMIRKQKKQVLLTNCFIQHNLSVMDLAIITTNRYTAILQAEYVYHKKYQKNLFKEYKFHLFLRTLKQFFTVKNRKLYKITFQFLVK